MTEGIKIETIPDLTKRILDNWRQKEKEALAQQKEQEEKLMAAVQEEGKITSKLETARSIVEKMELEYIQIEAKIEGEKKAQIEVNSIREQDVKSGKVTLAEFLKKGKTEQAIYNEAVKETMKDLEAGLKAARAKRLEILNFEKELLETQTNIRYLIIEPGRILQRVLKELSGFAEVEIGIFLQEIHSSKYQLEQARGKLLLTEGKSLGPGYTWTRLTVKQAYGLQFDPILPLECIAELKSRLESHKDSEMVNVTFFLRTKGVDITSIHTGGEK